MLHARDAPFALGGQSQSDGLPPMGYCIPGCVGSGVQQLRGPSVEGAGG